MKNVVLAATALCLIGGSSAYAAKAKTYSISITGVCDHLTIMVDSSGDAYGSSDTSDCDQSAVAGSTAKLSAKVAPGGSVIEVGGDLGYGSSEGWSWAFNLKTGTGVLRGTDGTDLFGPSSFAFTFTDAAKVSPRKNGAPTAVSLLRKH